MYTKSIDIIDNYANVLLKKNYTNGYSKNNNNRGHWKERTT